MGSLDGSFLYVNSHISVFLLFYFMSFIFLSSGIQLWHSNMTILCAIQCYCHCHIFTFVHRIL